MDKKNENNILNFKIITVGDGSVGKTSIIRRLVYNNFLENTLNTVGMNMAHYKVTLQNNKIINLTIVDTAGQERYKSLGKKYFSNADGILFVFAHDNLESFENIKDWMKIFEESSSSRIDIPKFLVGNKNDLESEVDENLIDEFLNKNKNFKYKSTSAKKEEDNQIKELFQELGEDLYEDYKIYGNKKIKNIQLRDGNSEKKTCVLAKCLL